MDCLMVIDMQEDYVGKKRNTHRYPYDTESLIEHINDRIKSYPKEAVIYVKNRFFWEISSKPKVLVEGLYVVNEVIFTKRKASSFSSQALLAHLHKIDAKRIEIIGVDGNFCIASSALEGARRGFEVVCNEECIGIGNKKKFERTKIKLKENGIKYV